MYLPGALLPMFSAIAATAALKSIPLDFSVPGASFEGIGALSGGGGVTRLLIDYPQPLQDDIFDILFKPNAGASLQIIKVEIGGDTQSTEGTELSHSHVRGDLNCTRGYEWLVLTEAKKRNPAIRTYGLAWGVPGWIGDQEDPNGSFYTQDNINYHLSWLDCALNTHGVEIDYMGVWNERGADPAWTIQLRAAMDAAGYLNTRIVSADTGWEPVVGDMTTDSAYAAAVDVVGAHYPGAPPAAAYKLNKTLFASEMWNLGYVDDWPGALKLASDLSDHASWGLSASILWCLIYSWYAPLPFSRVIPGTQAGAGHSILTAGEPWSGNYQLNPTIHAMAHHTQFAEPGWVHLPVDAPGLGPLPGGGALVTRFNPRTPAGVLEFSIVAHTAGATESQDVVFTLPAGTPRPPAALNVWFTNETMAFARAAPVADGGGGAYAITLAPNSLYTLTTRDGGGGPAPVNPIPPSAPFPFPYADAFEGYAAGAYAKYFCDEGGAFVVAPVPAGFSRADGAAAGGNAYFQVVTKVPIVWEKNPDPYTLIGDFNAGSKWSDYTVSVDVAVGPSAAPPPEPPPGPVEAAVTAPCAPSGVGQAFTLSTGGGWPAQLRAVGAPGQCLGITGSGDLYPGAEDVGLQACASAPAWAFDASTRQLREVGADRCLDVLSANTSAGARVIAFSCKSAPVDANQRWALANVSAAQGAVALQSALRAPPLCVGFAQLPPAPAGAAPYVFVAMRIGKYERNGPPPSGYTLKVALSANATAGGTWALQFAGATLAQGVTKAPVLPGVFHTATVGGKGPTVTASWDGDVLAQISDSKSAYGMAAVGSGWHEAFFDNFKVE